jgi:hypothetical protein
MRRTSARVEALAGVRAHAQRSRLITLDGVRAGARSAGAELAAGELIADPDDVFFLALDELLEATKRNQHEAVAERRNRYMHFCRVSAGPVLWRGVPLTEHLKPDPPGFT